MKIVSIEAIPVNLPFKEPVSDSWGIYHSSNHGIVIVWDESGQYGAGEISLAWFGGAHALCREVNEHWAPRLSGLDVCNLTGASQIMDSFCHFSKRHLLAKAGVEMALWDLLGKNMGLPVSQLLGGRLRERIPLTGGIAMYDVDYMVNSAQERVAAGYKELKLKVGIDDAKDIAAVVKVRGVVPDTVKLRVDANMAWKDAKQAKQLIDEMTRLGVCIVEQPLASDRLTDLAWLRQNTTALILIDEGVWDVADAKTQLDAGTADMLHVYVCEAGGLQGARRIFELAALHYTDCTLGSMPEGQIGAAASAHVGAAMPNLSVYASDVRGFTAYRDDVVAAGLTIENGELLVPEGPGLGVTVDFEKLARLRVDS